MSSRADRRAPALWVDVEDLYEFVRVGAPRPTGIQRVAFELCRALRAGLPPGRLGVLRHAGPPEAPDGGFAAIDWDELQAMFTAFTSPPAPPAPSPPLLPPPRAGMRAALARRVRSLLDLLPGDVRVQLVRGVRLQLQVPAALAAAASANLRPPRVPAPAPKQATAAADAPVGPTADWGFADDVRPGDVLLATGASFVHPGYSERVARAKAAYGLRFGLLTYDIIPLRRPEFCPAADADRFGGWLHAMLPLCDWVLAISRHGAAELTEYAADNHLALPGPVIPLPLGTGFSTTRPCSAEAANPGTDIAGEYVLQVSTIDARKNQALMFRVWSRLLAAREAARASGTDTPRVPRLVFVGKIGWMVEDLMQQLANTDYLGGHVVVVPHASDDDLARLYRGCLFTVFPSFCEGRGLAVTESLAFGKPCIASNATAVPEAGGGLARYFDPEDGNAAYRLIRDTLADRPALAAWTAEVAHGFRPAGWNGTAEAILRAMLPGSVP